MYFRQAVNYCVPECARYLMKLTDEVAWQGGVREATL